jgi:hypothetical protein
MKKGENKMLVRIVDYYDVLGNEEEGYDVNGIAVFGEYNVRKDFDGFNLLKKVGFLSKEATRGKLDVYSLEEDYEEYYDKKTGMPLCRIEWWPK